MVTEATGSDKPQLNASNWLNIISNLKLTALTRQLADNSAFIAYKGEKITLNITTELAHLVSEKAQQRLESVLGKYLEQTIKIIFQQNTVQEQSTATLAAERSEQTNINQQRATDSIHNDQAIDAMRQAFGARVIESTIKPLT